MQERNKETMPMWRVAHITNNRMFEMFFTETEGKKNQ